MQVIVNQIQAVGKTRYIVIAAEYQVTFGRMQLRQQLQTPCQSTAILQQSYRGGSDVEFLQIEET